MDIILKITMRYKQKIPSINEILVGLYPLFFAIPRKTYISGHFHLNTNIINKKITNFWCSNTLILN